jgi:hypothetical protein
MPPLTFIVKQGILRFQATYPTPGDIALASHTRVIR